MSVYFIFKYLGIYVTDCLQAAVYGTCATLYSVQAHQICEKLHSMDLSEMRGKTIAKVSIYTSSVSGQ